MRKKSLRLSVLFSLGIFLLFCITMFLSTSLGMLLMHLGIIQAPPKPETLPIAFAPISILIGTLIAQGTSKRMMAPIVEISEATKQVAKGNFQIQLKERSRAQEINEMSQNFMLMTQELASIETFRNDFISNVSHEFKTPLAAIEGYAMLLQKPGLSPEKQAAYVSKILANTKRLSKLTGNILQLSQLENQNIMPEKQVFSLDEQLRQVILLYEDRWSQKELELDINLAPVDYEGNRDLLFQVWQNILGNAIKFTNPGGSIRISLQKEEQGVQVEIADTGIGMSQEVQKRMFEKFYQGNTSHSSEGNGLGLTLAKRIIDLHGGSIIVRSQEGAGACFCIMLPISPQKINL